MRKRRMPGGWISRVAMSTAWRRVIASALGLGAALVFFSIPAFAHDYWLQADKYNVAPTESVVVHLNLGSDMSVESEKAYEAARIERFELRFGEEYRDLVRSTREGATPVFNEPIGVSQPFLFTMVRSVARIEMTPQEFNEYVAHEGIPGVKAKRARERERYWRFLKLLGRAGEQTETNLHHRFTGAQFEIVLLQNPFIAAPGEQQIAQVLFETKPLAGITVTALHRDAKGTLTRLSSVADSHGVARFLLPTRGVWLFRSVHMRPCKGCDDADWESFWTAYSVEY